VREAGGQLSLRNVRPQVYEVLVMTRLTDILDVQPAT
jgi:anti-anti-sigma regulatory factor